MSYTVKRKFAATVIVYLEYDSCSFKLTIILFNVHYSKTGHC